MFITVVMPRVHTLHGQYDGNSLIKLAGIASTLLIAPLVIAAAMSQFSAAVADTLAATDNMAEITHGGLKAKFGTVLARGGTIALSWSANTVEILALASRALALYYMLQCLVAINVGESIGQRLGMAAIAVVLGLITIFAVPAG